MKCFYHHELDAVGVCKACSKGLCPECAEDVGGGIACASGCGDLVREVNKLVRANAKAQSKSAANYFLPTFLSVLGVVFVAAPVLAGKPVQLFTSVLGGALIAFGLFLFVYIRRFRSSLSEPD